MSEKSASRGFESLPDIDLFSPLIADPRESQFSVRFERQLINDQRFTAASVSFGDYLPLFNYGLNDGATLQLSFDGAMYAIFNLDTPSYDLTNTDYFVGFSLSHKKDSLSLRLRLHHVSGHLGDEFILENPDFDRNNSSQEDLDLLLAKEFEQTRVYAGGCLIVRSNSVETNQPWHARTGLEWRRPQTLGQMDLLLGLDLRTMQRTDWKLSNSVLAGFSIAKSTTREIRLMVNYYYGNSPHGQFFNERISYWGLGVYFII